MGTVIYPSRDLQGFLAIRVNTTAVVSAIDFKKDINFHSCLARDVIKRRWNLRIVGEQREFGPLSRQLHSLVEFPRIDWKGVCDLPKSMRLKAAGLCQGRHRDCARVSRGLYARNFDAFVRLDMRPKLDAQPVCSLRHLRCVAAHPSDIKKESRSLQGLQS